MTKADAVAEIRGMIAMHKAVDINKIDISDDVPGDRDEIRRRVVAVANGQAQALEWAIGLIENATP